MLPRVPLRVRHSRPVSQPPVHSLRRLSPRRLLRSCSSSAAQNPSACSFARLPRLQSPGGRAGQHAQQAVPACLQVHTLCSQLRGRRHGTACQPLATALCPEAPAAQPEAQKEGRKMRGRLGALDPSQAAGSLDHTHPFHAFPSPLLSRSVAAVDRGMRRQSNNVQTGLCFRSENQENRKTRVRPGTER